MSIRAKLIIAIVASMLAIALATGALVRDAGERNVRIAAQQSIASAGQAFAAMEKADVEKLDATLRALAAHPGLVDAFEKRDRAKLLAMAAPIFDLLKANHDITHFYFLEPEPSRKVFLRVHKPSQHGDVVHRATLSRAIDTLAIGAGKELGQTAFALRVVRPWYTHGGDLAGYVELGEEIDHFLTRMKAQTGDDYGLLVEKAFLDRKAWAGVRQGKRNNWDDRARTVVVNTTTTDEGIVDFEGDASAIPDQGLLLGEEVHGEGTYARGILPVKDAAGRRVGGLFVLHEISKIRASMLSARRGIYAVLAAVSVILSALLVSLVNRMVLARLDALRKTMDTLTGHLAAGDLSVAPPRATQNDEVGRYEDALGKFVEAVLAALKSATSSTRKSG